MVVRPVIAPMMAGTLNYRVAFVASVVTGMVYLAIRAYTSSESTLHVILCLLFEAPLAIWIMSECTAATVYTVLACRARTADMRTRYRVVL
jgi:hypothetical protein